MNKNLCISFFIHCVPQTSTCCLPHKQTFFALSKEKEDPKRQREGIKKRVSATMQAPVKLSRSDKPCDICGDVGFEELIATCSKCSIAREHVYCMWVNLLLVPKDWICESCLSKNIVSPEACRKKDMIRNMTLDFPDIVCHESMHTTGPSSRGQAYSKRQKHVETGKVKFIPTEEVIKLSSGASEKGNRFRVKVYRGPEPSGLVKFPRHGGVHSMTNQPPPQALKKLKEPKAPVTFSKEYGHKEQLVAAFASAKVAGTFKTNVEKATNKASCASSPSKKCMPVVTIGGNFEVVAECKNSIVEERELLNILPKFKLCCDNLPSLHVTWKGGFSFTAAPVKFYGEFQARPPFTVSCKALEFSKRMPPVLQVQLLPRCQMWADLFQNDYPDFKDIALYFFPSDNIERSKGNIACLIELMEVQSSMMRSCIDGVELLIFTSKQLHMDSQEYFLWGVFRAIENDQTLDKADEEDIPFISPLDCVSNDHTCMENGEAVDMEIDMVGGENVGRVDVVVSKDACRRLSGISEAETVTGSTLKNLEGKILNVSALSYGDIDKTRSDFALELPLQSSNGRYTVDEFGIPRFTVDQLSIPPGFEKIGKTRLKRYFMSDRNDKGKTSSG